MMQAAEEKLRLMRQKEEMMAMGRSMIIKHRISMMYCHEWTKTFFLSFRQAVYRPIEGLLKTCRNIVIHT